VNVNLVIWIISSSGHRCSNDRIAQLINDDQMTK